MDWVCVIEKNRAALKCVVAALAAMARLGGSTSPLVGEDGSARRGEAEALAEPGEGYISGSRTTLPRHLHRAVLRLLRPAEAAVRRLVIVVALAATPQARKTGDIVPPPPARPRKPKPQPVASVLRSLGIAVVLPQNVPHPEPVEGEPRRTPARKLTLPLFDPIRVPRPGRPRYVPSHATPRILSFDGARPYRLPPPPSPDDPIDAARLNLRLAALASALDDLPKHAKRFARWRSRVAAGAQNRSRDAAGAQDGRSRHRGLVGRLTPLRPGRPPGLSAANRRRPAHEVHGILADMQCFAVDAMKRPNTS